MTKADQLELLYKAEAKLPVDSQIRKDIRAWIERLLAAHSKCGACGAPTNKLQLKLQDAPYPDAAHSRDE